MGASGSLARVAAAVVAACAVATGAAAGEGGSSSSRAASARPVDPIVCDGEDLSAWLYDSARWAPPGYHVLCVDHGAGTDRRVRLWAGGHAEGKPSEWVLPGNTDGAGLDGFRAEVQRRAKMRAQRRWRILPWALHSARGGALVVSGAELQGALLAFEGGRWIWPGVREGFERSVPLEGVGNVTLKTLTLDPLAFTIDGFLSKEAARHIVATAKPKLKPAELAMTDSGVEAGLMQARTCSEAWVGPKENEHIEAVSQRTAVLTRVPRRLQVDPLRFLQYKKGEQFVAHTDYYEKEDFKQDPKMMKELKHGRNWLVTLYLYLSDVKAGGETYFPSTYGKPLPVEMDNCEGPAVGPRTGRALMFYSLHPDGKPNLSSMHGGCKVRKGVKYTVNIWTFNQDLNEGELRKKEEAAVKTQGRSEL